MLKTILLATACLLTQPALALTSGPDAGGYYMYDSNEANGPTYAYQDISTTGTPYLGGDDTFISVPIGFTFNFYGVDSTIIEIVTNGFLNLDQSGSVTWNNTESSTGISLPLVMPFDPLDPNRNTNAANPLATSYIAPNFVDQNPATNSNPIYYQTLGTAPNRTFVVQYMIPHLDFLAEIYDYQVILYEGSNDILFQYQTIANTDLGLNNGSFSTVGIQGSATAGTNYQSGQADYKDTNTVGQNSGVLASGLAVLFTVPPVVATPPSSDNNLPEAEVPTGGGGGCMTAQLNVTLLPLLLMFGAGIVIARRKRS